MRRTRAITLTLLSAAMLTSACGRSQPAKPPAPPDRTWYDANHNPVPEIWEERDGKRVPNPIPHDRYGRPWVQDANGEWGPLPPPGDAAQAAGTSHTTSTHTYSHGPSIIPWLWGGSGYRSYSAPPPQASRPPAAGARPGTGGTGGPSGAGVSRGGFGGTGSSAGS